jgi:excisionase family DNA binding protein
VPEVITTCRISRSTVDRAIAAGRLKAVKVGTKVLVETASLDAFFAAGAIQPHAPRVA